MQRLGDDATELLREAGVAQQGQLADVTRVWPAAVGDAIARAAWPARIGRDGTLHVATVSSTWAFELDRLSGEVIGRLESALGRRAPTSLRFAPGNVPEPGPDPSADRPDPPLRPGEEDAREGARLAAGIADEELRELVARAASASLSRRRSDRHFW